MRARGHVIGALRAGTDVATILVDADLRSHDHENLSIAGSSIFPTSATANPALTIAAMPCGWREQ
ncbi:GMC oxidoreductase [Paracoccus pacificus]|uniref:GMC oxidoreductase n=1 Tax=Paracoccus pacificus TaxID=1463598 RepID=A0ABW4RC33_9RHOB